jgi:GT2 family glycosyltransferase
VEAPPPPAVSGPEATRLLVGPHGGKLGAPTKRYSIVIVTYQSAAFIEACLGSVLPTLGAEDEVIVVDNASKDDTVARIKKLGGPNVTVVANKENRGYAPAANQGIRKSKGEFIVLLNPDTEVHTGWLAAMAARLEEGVGAVGPLSDAITGDQFIGHYIPAGAGQGVDGLGNLVTARFKGQTLETKFVVGMCVVLPRHVLDRAGLLDDQLILGADDLDLSWRLRCLGYKLKIALDAFVHHAEHASFDARSQTETAALVAQSDALLVEKLRRYYGSSVPTSQTLWGCEIFSEALRRGPSG